MRALVVLLLFAGQVRAEPWYRGRYGTNRIVHVAITGAAGGLYIASEALLKPELAPTHCHWCQPDSLDASVRNALVWNSPKVASAISNGTGYLLPPIVGIGLVLLGSASAHPQMTWAIAIDDTIPILETVAVSQLAVQVIKFSAGRQRPYAHYGTGLAPTLDDNVSFLSGHSALAFSIAASAGTIAHRRHYRTEPYIWSIGMTVAATTAYLRIAADEHYLTDVLAGSALGAACGLTIPLLMQRGVEVTPTGNGVALVGIW